MHSVVAPLLLISVAGFAQAAERLQDLAVVEVVGHTLLDEAGVPLSEVPANVRTVTGDAAREQGAYNLADALNHDLGAVSVSNGTGNPYQNDVSYRGYRATSSLGAPVGLSVYFDGVRMNEPFGSNVNWELLPMNAIRSIGVLPGSNPMFGLNTLGGALVITTKNGQDDAGFSVGAVEGSFHRRSGEFEAGWVDARHAMDHFLSANVDAQDGFRSHSPSRVAQLYGKTRWHGNDDRSVLELSLGLADTRLSGTQSLPMDMLSDRRSAYTWPDQGTHRAGFLNLKGTHGLSDEDELAGNLYYRRVRSRNLNSNAELDDGCFNADGSLAAATVGGMTTFKCGDKAPGGTATNAVTGTNALALGFARYGNAINTSLVYSATQTDTVGAALQWSRRSELGGRRNSLSAGVVADESRIRYGQDTRLARLQAYGLFATPNLAYGFTANGAAPSPSNLPQFGGSPLVSSVQLSSTTRDLALYLTDTLHLTQRLNFTASGSFSVTMLQQSGANSRYLNDDGGYSWTDDVAGVTYYNPEYAPAWKYSNAGDGVAAKPNGVPAGAAAGPETNGLEGSHRFQRFNPALGFNYNVDARLGLFGGYSEALRAPTSIELSCADPRNPCALPTGFNGDPPLEAVVTRTFEIGGRGSLGEILSWNFAAYQSRIRNDIQFIATSNTYGYFANVGGTERRGAELGLLASWPRLLLSGDFGYVEALYRSSFVTAQGEHVTPGNRIPGIPSSTFKLRARYDLTPSLRVGGTLVTAAAQYAHGNESNTDSEGKVAGYAVLNLDLNYRVNAALKFSAHIDNALRRSYSTYGLSGMTSIYTLATQQFRTPAPPRAAWVGVSYSFGGEKRD